MTIKWILSGLMIVFYACAVMYLLLDVQWAKLSPKRKLWGAIYFSAFIVLNVLAQLHLGYRNYGKYYLLLTQLPVFVLFLMISQYRGIKLFFILLTAVLFSAPVMVITNIIRCFFGPSLWIRLLCCVLALMLIKRFFKKPFNRMLALAEDSMFMVFTMIPLLYYIYSYALTHYQLANMVINTRYFILQIPLLIALISYVLLVQIFQMISEKAELKNVQNLVTAQLNAATEQIKQLRIAERQSAIYRHDLRHHMNYLNVCITGNKLQEATDYITQTYRDMDKMTVERYSVNEPVNLILSSYASKAREMDVAIEIHVTDTDFSRFLITDLCSLLANALENAIKASSRAESSDSRYVNLRLYEKNHKLCLEIRNGYTVEPIFEQGIPVSQEEGHGIGVKSMLHVVEKYKGVYRFLAKDGVFSFQMSI